MGRAMYNVCVGAGRCIGALTVRKTMLHRDRLPAEGGYLLAPTHISHLDPIVMSVQMPRQVHWMTRIEFYRSRPMAWWLNRMGTFPVRRFGVPVSSIRTAIQRTCEGNVVGVFPEGGVAIGENSVMRGGAMKRGVLLIAQRAGAGVVPVAIAGSRALCSVDPWLPFRRGRIWINFGEPYQMPRGNGHRRADRIRASEELISIYQALYQELLDTTDLTDDHDAPPTPRRR